MDTERTVEANHSNILHKLDLVGGAIRILDEYDLKKMINTITHDRYGYVVRLYTYARNTYEMDVVDVLTSYYDESIDTRVPQPKAIISDTYGMRVISENYIGNLNQCMRFIEDLYKHMRTNIDVGAGFDKLSDMIHRFKRSPISIGVKGIDYDICVCGADMEIFPMMSEIVCPSCGIIAMMYGTVFEDSQFYSQEGQRSKHGTYEPSRHCKFWVHRIQARENTDIPKKCIDQLVQCMRRDGVIDGRRLMCSQIRQYLKETRNTEFNDHVPLIRKIITGIAPPQLSGPELRVLYNLFDKTVNVFETVKPSTKSNTMYYPYIIYKILELSMPGNRIRKKKILECIHLQSRDTLIANDNIWEKICNIVSSIRGKYKPTDRNDQKIDL